jgi:hypothetical protein
MTSHSIFLLALLAISLHGLYASAVAAPLQNASARLDFNLQTGCFSLAMPPTASFGVCDAHAAIEGWASSDGAYQRRVVEQTACRMVVECVGAAVPTLLLEFTLHPAFVELRAGLKNTTPAAVRIKTIRPLVAGAVFPGAAWTNVRSLDAPSGANQPRVTATAVRSSPNNLLLTFKQAGERHSLVMGALQTADFTKWAQTTPAAGTAGPELQLPGLRLVDYLDCGAAAGDSLLLRVVRGKPYTWPGTDEPFGTVLFDEKAVAIQAAGLDPKKRYALGFSWWDQDGNGRVESVAATGSDQQRHLLIEKRSLPRAAGGRSTAVALPAACYADGKCTLTFTNEAAVPNAVVSELWLWELAAGAALPATVTDQRTPGAVVAGLEAYDPIGRLVDPGETYLSADSFYVDVGTANPFDALEQYGRELRQATGANPNPYDFPTVCAWYAGVWHTPEAQDNPAKSTYQINTSAGMVGEAAAIKQTGFLNYSRAAVRLVPDSYTELNPQGWWDDAHWQRHGYYTAPYETSAKLGDGMHANGCLAFIYIQPMIQPPAYKHLLSRDFREAHPEWLLNRRLDTFYNLDYSLPAVQDHLRARFGALRGNLDGLMVDYADQLWLALLYGRSPDARLACSTYENIPPGDQPQPALPADAKLTATGFYRLFFSLLRQGLGPEARIHERAMEQPNNDLTLGLVDSQRTALDTDRISPDLVSRSGLRWYKNRGVLAYDMDSKELTQAWKIAGWTGSDQDGRRMLLTMAYVAASRLLLANSFRDLTPEVLHDLERTFPYPTEPRSARPVDAFIHPGWPRVYDFAVTPDWHQVTLFNNTLPTREETIAVALAGDPADGALGLDPRQEYYIYDFWNETFVGRFKGSGTLVQTLRPGEARMLSVRKAEPHPQVLSTNRHLMQGHLDLSGVNWDGHRLVGKAMVVGGEPFKIVVALNGSRPENVAVSADGQLGVLTIKRPHNETVEWSIP